MTDKDLDSFRYGARAIGAEADIFKKDRNGETVLDENGKPVVDERRAQYALEMKYIDADKFGRLWRSTPRRIRQIA